ncbi:MAG: zinc ribbon domain-containing protein [Clostridia bacterium]|nr:zinc ribbon domain-containing protein [Clostridia bacterium]
MFCRNCGAQVSDQAKFCNRCGYQFGQVSQPVQPAPQPVQQYVPIEEPPMPTGHGNVFMGIIGAVLFALLGGLAYVAVYQAGVIAGICGFVIFAAAGFGYRLFARTKNKYSLVSLITAIVLTVAVILVAEYVAIAVDVYMEYGANGMSLGEAFESTFNVISESGEVGEVVMEELAYAYIFGFAAIIFDVIRIVKGRNRQKQQVKQNQ